MSSSYSSDDLAGLFALSTLGISAVAVIATIVIFLLLFVALYIVFCYPYYRMAKKANMPNAWLAFIPWANVWLQFNLSDREYNVFNWIKTRNRTTAFWIYVAVSLGGGAIYGVLAGISSLLVILLPLAWLFYMVYLFAVYVLYWRVNYDLLMTYGMEEHAMWASIVNCFCPIVMVVFSFIIMNKEPIYENGNYK